MPDLVAITHPPTGRTLYMHPDLAVQQHHWLHPEPSVPTPPESLPLFDAEALQRLIGDLAQQLQPTPDAADTRQCTESAPEYA